MPPGAWDSHVHVVNEKDFPFDENHPFRPKKADLDDLLHFERTLGIDHVCLTSISVYGTDNSLLRRRLRELNGRGRAVVSIDPQTITDQELDEMHATGVRGVRLNLKSTATRLDEDTLKLRLIQYSRRIRRLKWSLNLHVGLSDLPTISDFIRDQGVVVVLDHLATPQSSEEPMAQKGFAELKDLLSRKSVWIKLSGLYRFAATPGIDEYVKEVLRIAPTQVVWASDWPHTGGKDQNPGGDRKQPQEYRKVDVLAFLEDCLHWCDNDEDLMHKILVDNPRRLWQYNT